VKDQQIPNDLSGRLVVDVTDRLLVPAILPDAPEFQTMPPVLATGYLVALAEWACIRLLVDHLDSPAEQTVGTHVNLTHEAATPAGLQVTFTVALVEVSGRRLEFAVEAHDGVDVIARGTHQRHIIDTARFITRASQKAAR
jgi:fluoroacetyl-CoA thioesterase